MLDHRTLFVVALLAVVLAGCRLEVQAELTVERDGGGTAAVVVTFDAGLLEQLDELAVDPTAELTAAATADEAWTIARRATEEDGLELTLRHEADTPAALTAALRELSAGLSEDDPALVVDLDLTVDTEGAAALDGTVQLRPPAGPGMVVEDEEAAELAELVRTSVEASLAVTLPGPITADDADRVDGRTLRWKVTPGEARAVTAVSAAPTGWATETIAAAVAGGALVLAVTAVAVVLRRRRGQQRT